MSTFDPTRPGTFTGGGGPLHGWWRLAIASTVPLVVPVLGALIGIAVQHVV